VLPTSPGGNRTALIGWTIAAVIGTFGVWWLSSYMDTLATLAETDREGALALFRSRALPALFLVVGVAVAAGVFLMRQGLQLVNRRHEDGKVSPEVSPDVSDEEKRARSAARLMGWMLASAGFLMAAVPLALLSVVFWILNKA
jgi:hypothetical protein